MSVILAFIVAFEAAFR